MEADLLVDGVTKTLEGDLAFKNSVIVRNGGQLKVGPSGVLKIRAKRIEVVDAASQINANNSGRPKRTDSFCTGFSTAMTALSAATASVEQAPQSVASAGQTSRCSNGNPCPAAQGFELRKDDLSAGEGLAYGSSPSGGLISLVAESIDLKGQVTRMAPHPARGARCFSRPTLWAEMAHFRPRVARTVT